MADTCVSRLNHVVFKDIQETYHNDQPMKISFVLDSSFNPSTLDRIGLYAVGWRSVRDHFSSVNLQLPLDDRGSGIVTLVDLPKDEEEFYQLCYVDGSSRIHGASSPFQFVADDYEVIEDLPDASILRLSDSIDECGEGEKTAAAERPMDQKSCKTIAQVETESAEDANNLSLSVILHSTVEVTDKENKAPNALYPMPTWFHNPYSNYIPVSITDFTRAKVECTEIWPTTTSLEEDSSQF